MDKIRALADLRLIKKILGKLNVKFFLMYGTLLGVYRDKDFIEHDTDIDIGILGTDNIDRVRIELENNNFRIVKNSPRHIHFHVERGVITDIHFYRDTGKNYQCFIKEGKPYLWFPKRFGTLKSIKVFGDKYYIPTPTEELLKWLYGDWKNKNNRNSAKVGWRSK